MNKTGSAIIVYFMLGVVFFLIGMALAPSLNKVITGDNVMGANGLDCSNSSISNQDKANCMSVDVIPPIWLGVILGLGSILVGRVLL